MGRGTMRMVVRLGLVPLLLIAMALCGDKEEGLALATHAHRETARPPGPTRATGSLAAPNSTGPADATRAPGPRDPTAPSSATTAVGRIA
jgi:hypothetical protein